MLSKAIAFSLLPFLWITKLQHLNIGFCQREATSSGLQDPWDFSHSRLLEQGCCSKIMPGTASCHWNIHARALTHRANSASHRQTHRPDLCLYRCCMCTQDSCTHEQVRLAARSNTLTQLKLGLSWPEPTVSLISESQTSYPTRWLDWLEVH